MIKVRSIVVGICLLVAPSAMAEEAKPAKPAPSAPMHTKDARMVPVVKDGAFVGIKVYAIRAGGRFDQAKFSNGDTIEKIDGISIVTDDGTKALHDKVVLGKADAVVTVRRKGELVELQSKAVR